MVIRDHHLDTVLITCRNFVILVLPTTPKSFQLLRSLHIMSYRALVLSRPLSRGVPLFCPAAIMFMQGFRTRIPPVVVSHGVFRHVHSSPRAMDTRQKHDDNKPVVHSAHTLRTLLSSAIRSYGSAEVALLHIMKMYGFSDSLLDRVLTSMSILI